MAMAFVQGVVKSSAGTPAAAPAFASSIAVGDLIVVYAATDTATTGRITGVTDSKGNTYTHVPSFNVAANAVSLDGYYTRVTVGGASNVVTIAFNDTADNLNAVIQHFNGFTGTVTLDQKVMAAQASSKTWTSGNTPTTTNANELVVGAAVHASTVSAFSLGSGYTNLTQSSVANCQIAMESKVVAATGAQAATFSVAAARAGIAAALTFYDAPAGTTYTQSLTASVSPSGSLSSTYIPVLYTQSLIDDFNDNSRDTTKWDIGVTGAAAIAEVNQQTEITLPSAATASDYATLNAHNFASFINSYMYLRVVQVPSATTSADATLTAFADSNNWMRTVYEAGTLYFQYMKAGTRATAATITYNSTSHKWWRLREGTAGGGTAGTIYWDTSPDAITWTNQASFVHGMATSFANVKANIEGYTYQVETNPGKYIFDNFNTPGGAIYTQSLTASVSPAGSFSKRIGKSFTAGLTSGGTFIKRSARNFVASMTPTGSLVKQFLKSFTASLSPTGALSSLKVRLVTLTASLSPAGSLVKQIGKSITASVTPTGSISRLGKRAFTASLTPTGSLVKRGTRALTAALPMTGSIVKQVGHKMTAGMTSSGSISRAINKNLTANLTPTGSLARQLVKIMLLTANMTFTGAINVRRYLTLVANMTFSGSLLVRWISGVASIFAPLTAIVKSTINGIIDSGANNVTVMSGAEDDTTVQDSSSVATVNGTATITDISANTNTDTLNNPTNKAEL